MDDEHIAMILDAIRDHERAVLDNTEGDDQRSCQERIDLIDALIGQYRVTQEPQP